MKLEPVGVLCAPCRRAQNLVLNNGYGSAA